MIMSENNILVDTMSLNYGHAFRIRKKLDIQLTLHWTDMELLFCSFLRVILKKKKKLPA
jgi:hypothetical protein